jgi:hypothetical protein
MRVLVPALLLASVLLAGCASSPSPVQDAEAAHAGAVCPAGSFVNGFLATGSPNCAPPAQTAAACAKGEVMTGVEAAGAPRCWNVLDVIEEAEGMRPKPATPATPTSPPPAKTMSLSSDGALSSSGGKTYTIASTTSGMRWSDIIVTVNGAAINQTHAATNGVSACPASPEAATVFLVCVGSAIKRSTDAISAGDSLRLTGLSSGQGLRILDAKANSVILTLTVG